MTGDAHDRAPLATVRVVGELGQKGLRRVSLDGGPLKRYPIRERKIPIAVSTTHGCETMF